MDDGRWTDGQTLSKRCENASKMQKKVTMRKTDKHRKGGKHSQKREQGNWICTAVHIFTFIPHVLLPCHKHKSCQRETTPHGFIFILFSFALFFHPIIFFIPFLLSVYVYRLHDILVFILRLL